LNSVLLPKTTPAGSTTLQVSRADDDLHISVPSSPLGVQYLCQSLLVLCLLEGGSASEWWVTRWDCWHVPSQCLLICRGIDG
jgi:hypothetical protein